MNGSKGHGRHAQACQGTTVEVQEASPPGGVRGKAPIDVPICNQAKIPDSRRIEPSAFSCSKAPVSRHHGSRRSQTAVSWNTAPPAGGPGSSLVRALMPMPPSKYSDGQTLSDTSTPRP